MDYIQEELRRQKRALARLLLGATAEPEEARRETKAGEWPRQEGAGAFPKRRGPSPLPAGALSAGEEASLSPAGGGEAAGAWTEAAGEEIPSWPEEHAGGALFPWPEMERRADGWDGAEPLSLPTEAGEAAAVYQNEEAEDNFPAGTGSGGALAAEAVRRRARLPEEAALPWGRGVGEAPAETAFHFGQASFGPEFSALVAAALSPEGGKTAARREDPLSPAGGAAGSARELSRIFQRDARRYDGAFAVF